MKENLKYETPEVEIIEVEVEQGFAVSDGTGNIPGQDPWG